VIGAGRVGVVLGVGAIADDENLHILIQATSSPEAVSLISVYLVERLFELDAPSFEFDMNQGQTIDQNGNIISGVVAPLFLLILVDDLKKVVVDVPLVYQIDVLALASVAPKHLNVVFLYLGGFGFDAIIFVREVLSEKPFPFTVSEGIAVEFLQLHSEVVNKVFLLMDGQIFIALFGEGLDEVFLEHRLALIFVELTIRRLELTDYGIFFVLRYDVVSHSCDYAFFLKDNNLSL